MFGTAGQQFWAYAVNQYGKARVGKRVVHGIAEKNDRNSALFSEQLSLSLNTQMGSWIKLHGRSDMDPGASPPARHVSAAHFIALAEDCLADGGADGFGGGLGFFG